MLASAEKICSHTLGDTLFLLFEQFYKNNEAQIWPKTKNNVRTIEAGVWNHRCKVTFLNKILLFSSNSTVSSVEILQMLRSIRLGIFGIF